MAGKIQPNGDPIELEARWRGRLTTYTRLELLELEQRYRDCVDCEHRPDGALRESHAAAARVARVRLNEMVLQQENPR